MRSLRRHAVEQVIKYIVVVPSAVARVAAVSRFS
jgi:hypothetical protein